MKVTHIISNKVWGGGEQYVYDLCQHLINDGYQVSIIYRNILTLRKKVASLGCHVLKLNTFSLLTIHTDIIHVHNFKDAIKVAIARKLSAGRYRIIVTRHLVRPAKTSAFYTWVYSQIDKIIFVSELARNAFFSTSPQVAKDKTCIIRNSICPSISTTTEDLRNTFSVEHTLLMYHGRLDPEKGLETLFHAFADSRLKNLPLHLFLAGTGSSEYTKLLIQLAEKLNIKSRISFLGFRHDITSLIRQIDIGVIPSIAAESCSLSCMEYMAAGKCIITTNNGGQAEYIENGRTGILVPPADSKSLTSAILNALKEKDTLGKNAATFFNDNLSYSIFYSKVKNEYFQVL